MSPYERFLMEPTEYILVSHEHSLVNLGLSEPTGLFTGKENFNRHLFSSPATEPHFSIPPLSDLTYHLNLFSDGALDLWIERIGQFNSKYLMVHNYKHLYWLKKFPWPFPYLFKTVLIYIMVNPVFFGKTCSETVPHQQREPWTRASAWLTNKIFERLSYWDEGLVLLQISLVPPPSRL